MILGKFHVDGQTCLRGERPSFECRTITSLIFRNFILSYDAERPMKAGMNVKSGARDHVVVKWTGLEL